MQASTAEDTNSKVAMMDHPLVTSLQRQTATSDLSRKYSERTDEEEVIRRVPTEEDEEEKVVAIKNEIDMEFGGSESDSKTGRSTSPDPHFIHRGLGEGLSDDDENGTPDVMKQDHDPSLNMRDIAIMHMAKKNLCFELEYIQTVCQSLDIRVSQHFGQYNSKFKLSEDPLMAFSESQNKGSAGVRFAAEEESKKHGGIAYVDSNQFAQKKMRLYLQNMYDKLNQMKKDVLKDDVKQTREDLKKHLTVMACCLERTRLYLDNYIYPRDMSLNLIDVPIEENSVSERKRAMHLTERLYTIVYKDFFTAYERVVLFNNKINKIAGKDIEEHNSTQPENPQRVSVVLNQDLLEDDRESIMMASQDIESNKLGKDAEDAKKHISKKQGNVNQDLRGVINILKDFHPNLPPFSNVEEVMDVELTFAVKFKSVISSNYELFVTLYQENSQPFSLTTIHDHQLLVSHQFQDQNYYFVNIPLRSILAGNLALIVKFVEKRRSKGPSNTQSIIGTSDSHNIHRIYKGFTILPISKLFWVKQLRVKQVYEIKEAQVYKPLTPLQIEDRYATLIEKRGFKKLKDVQLTQLFNLSYQYKMDVKQKEEVYARSNCTVVRPINFDKQMLYSKDQDQINLLKSKVEKYRFNDLKIDLNSLTLNESTIKKSPITRIEIALRDNYGVVYDTIYKTISDNQFNFMQTFESCIYPLEQDVKMCENFFVRIPTKSLETLKKIYVVFLVQTLVSIKDGKGNKIKATNYQNDIDSLMFRTEMVACLPLYDQNENCILKNKTYSLELFQIEDFKKAIPTKFENFRYIQNYSNLKPTGERITLTLRLISNEFTHNPYINNLLLIKDTTSPEHDVECILRSLKNFKESNEQILFHDKILDKLFQLMSQNKDPEIADLIFETIIVMIDLFQNRFVDYKDILENYISKHFAHAKVYLPLLHQIRKMSERIKEGLKESSDNEQKNNYVLMTMKYLGIILKIIRNSFLEALSCQDATPDANDGNQPAYQLDKDGHISQTEDPHINFYHNQKYEVYKKSMIAEENDEESDDYDQEDDDFMHRNTNRQTARKGAIRQTLQTTPSQVATVRQYDLTKEQFGVSIQKSLMNIFMGCHKDALKTTLSLRAILYENITNIFENITDFMDDQFLQAVLKFIYEEQHSLLSISKSANEHPLGNQSSSQQQSSSQRRESKRSDQPKLGGILKKDNDTVSSAQSKRNKTMRRSELQSVGGQVILFDHDYMKDEQNVRALQEWNWINEEAITKIKIIAMGKLLAHGILDKVQGDTNKIVMSFCENIERHHLRRSELNLHVFYYLYQLFQYIKSPDEFVEVEEPKAQKLKIYSKRTLDLKDFFTKILSDLCNYLRVLLKDTNIEDKVRDAKLPDEALKPFKEKASLVFLSVLNSVSKDTIHRLIMPDPKKLTQFVKSLKQLSNKITFQEPYMIYFEKKKVQVLRKVTEYIIQIFMDMDMSQLTLDHHTVIFQCRVMMIYLWNKLAKIKLDYKQTMRSKTLVKDQLKVHKGKMLDTFRLFWKKFMCIGQPWISIKGSMSKQFQNFIKLSNDKAIKLFMEIICDTMTFEYKETQDIYNTSSSIFKVFYELNMLQGKEELIKKFYENFEKTMCENNQLYLADQHFAKKIDQRKTQMKNLSESIQNVNYSRQHMKDNIFYIAYCQSQLIEVLCELKLFKLFGENQQSFESMNLKLENNLEVAYTYLRFVESMEHQSEDERKKIGQKEIVAHIQLNYLTLVQKYFTKAEFYEKAIEILNKQKDIAENMLYDYEKVSNIVKSQYKIYKRLSQDQDRHFAIYFKLGFFGQSFPNMLRGKEFIYRGSRLMKRADVKERLLRFFPDAFVLEYSSYPDNATKQSDKKSIQIQKVDPLTYLELKDFEMLSTTKDKDELDIGKKARDLPPKLRAYYLENFKNKFYKQTMLDNKQSGGEELQRDRLIEIFKVKNKFPSIFNMQEILKVKKFVRHAIDEAIRNIQVIIDTIEQLKKTATTTEDPSDFEFLTSQIRAALESPIQGGIVKFINIFITESNLKGVQREKTLLLFSKIEECDQVIFYGIQAIQAFTKEETMLTKINGDYNSFKETVNKVRQYIDGKAF